MRRRCAHFRSESKRLARTPARAPRPATANVTLQSSSVAYCSSPARSPTATTTALSSSPQTESLGRNALRGTVFGESQRLVIDAAVPDQAQVEQVVLPESPRRDVTGLRQVVQRAQHVAR